MARKRKQDNPSKYIHDTFLLKTEIREQLKYLDTSDKAELFDMILEYACSETIIESKSNMCNMVFVPIKSFLDYNWQKYKETSEIKEARDKLGGIISQLKLGNNISPENIQFLKDQGLFTKKYLTKKEVPKEVIDSLDFTKTQSNINPSILRNDDID